MPTAASKALPPRSRMPIPTPEAIQCVEATTPNVPAISGRVVNIFSCFPRGETETQLVTDSPWRPSRMSRWISTPISNPMPIITVSIAVPP